MPGAFAPQICFALGPSTTCATLRLVANSRSSALSFNSSIDSDYREYWPQVVFVYSLLRLSSHACLGGSSQVRRRKERNRPSGI
eukprot:scaffold55818_cov30-Tisochrysis_lutea.AAC.1